MKQLYGLTDTKMSNMCHFYV